MRAPTREAMDGDLLEAVYRSALEPAGWDDVMALTRRRFPSAMQAFYFLDRRQRRLRLVRLDGVEQRRVGEFDALYFAPDNPFMQVSAALHRPGVVRTNERIDRHLRRRDAIYGSAYYNDWMRPQGFRYTLGNTLLADGDHVANLTLMRPADMGTFTAGDVRAFEALSRHMTRALAVAVRLERVEAGAEGASFDALPQAMALVDRDGRVRHANPAMEGLLREKRDLRVEGGAIVAEDAAAQAALRSRVAAAIDGAAIGLRAAEPVELGRRGACRATVQVLPVHGRGGRFLPVDAQALLVVDDGRSAVQGPESFRLLHGCTGSEARLAALIVEGVSLRDAAQRMGITYGSARVYLKTVFQKVGVRSQAQLVAAARGTSRP